MTDRYEIIRERAANGKISKDDLWFLFDIIDSQDELIMKLRGRLTQGDEKS